MCEANVYLLKSAGEELLMKDAAVIRQDREEIYLENILGEKKQVRGRIREMHLLEHRILLEER